MPKPPLRPALNTARSEPDELSDIMAMLERPAEDEAEGQEDSGDIAALLEGLGASAREREEHEVRNLLEGMPELSEDGGEDAGGEGDVEAMEAGPDDEESVLLLQELYTPPRVRTSLSVESRELSAAPEAPSGASLEPPPVRRDGSLPTLVDVSHHPLRETIEGPLRPLWDSADDEGRLPVRPAPELPTRAGRDEPVMPPLRDPLASRRTLADKRLQQFVEEDIRTRLNFRILRLLLVSGIDRISLEELQEELVESRDALKQGLGSLLTAGLLLQDAASYAINPRARKLALLGTAVAQWQSPRHREAVWSWLDKPRT